jgi:hypothetical protein
MNTVVVVLGLIVGLLTLVYFMANINLSRQFHRQVAALFADSTKITRTYRSEQLRGLPDPVQRYFQYVLKDGQPYISYARITHDGQFKTGFDKKWTAIKGEQYATTQQPGFIWKGVTSIFTARDLFIADTGRLVVSLFSLFKVVDAKGAQYDQGELMRWLAESVLYPTNLLPDQRLQWEPVDSDQAKLIFHYNGLSLSLTVSFNDIGEITRLETKRYMDDKKLETWVIRLADYKDLNNVKIPTTFEVMWLLKKGDFPYAKFNLRKIEYDMPKAF